MNETKKTPFVLADRGEVCIFATKLAKMADLQRIQIAEVKSVSSYIYEIRGVKVMLDCD